MYRLAETKIEEISNILSDSVRETLSLSKEHVIFIGNEEKLFLFYLRKAFLAGFPIENLRCHMMYDIFATEFIAHPQPIPDKKEKKLKTILQFSVRKINSKYLYLKEFLQRTLFLLGIPFFTIHYTVKYKRFFIIPNLSNTIKLSQNIVIRKKFEKNLTKRGVEELTAKILSAAFPTSHLEGFIKINSSIYAKTSLRVLATSIYGIMRDPVLSAVIRNSRPKLYYVQHGGGYGLKKIEVHEIERAGCCLFLHWGLGENNIKITRYKEIVPHTLNKSQLLIIESEVPNIELYNNILFPLKKIKESFRVDMHIIKHPRSRLPDSDSVFLTRSGVSDREVMAAGLILFDNIFHTLIYLRILSRRPFFIVSTKDIDPPYVRGKDFVRLLTNQGVLVDVKHIPRIIGEFFQDSEDRNNYISEKFRPVWDFFDDLPTIESAIEDNPQ